MIIENLQTKIIASIVIFVVSMKKLFYKIILFLHKHKYQICKDSEIYCECKKCGKLFLYVGW